MAPALGHLHHLRLPHRVPRRVPAACSKATQPPRPCQRTRSRTRTQQQQKRTGPDARTASMRTCLSVVAAEGAHQLRLLADASAVPRRDTRLAPLPVHLGGEDVLGEVQRAASHRRRRIEQRRLACTPRSPCHSASGCRHGGPVGSDSQRGAMDTPDQQEPTPGAPRHPRAAGVFRAVSTARCGVPITNLGAVVIESSKPTAVRASRLHNHGHTSHVPRFRVAGVLVASPRASGEFQRAQGRSAAVARW